MVVEKQQILYGSDVAAPTIKGALEDEQEAYDYAVPRHDQWTRG